MTYTLYMHAYTRLNNYIGNIITAGRDVTRRRNTFTLCKIDSAAAKTYRQSPNDYVTSAATTNRLTEFRIFQRYNILMISDRLAVGERCLQATLKIQQGPYCENRLMK